MAMFESDKGSASESDVQVIEKDEEQPLQEEDDEDPSFKVRFHSLCADYNGCLRFEVSLRIISDRWSSSSRF